MSATSLVIFDCDGVLVDSEPLAALAYERVYDKHGMPGVSADVIAHCIGMKQADIIVKVRELTGHLLVEDKQGDIWAETRALFTERLQPTAGIGPFLDALELDRCVASSSSLERIHHSLDVTRLAPYFGDAIFSSSMVARGKPAPDIFLHAAKQMEAEPSACVVIEDLPFGVQGAVAAGMIAIGFTGGSHTYADHGAKLAEKGAVSICSTWDQVAHELARFGKS